MVHALIRELEEVRDRASEKVSDPGGAGLDAAGSACCLDETKAGWCLSDAAAAESRLRLRCGQRGEPDQAARGSGKGGRDHPGEVKGQSHNVLRTI